MKIASANLQMASSHTSSQQHQIRESMKMWVGQQRPDFEGRGTPPRPPISDTVSLSDAGMAAQSADSINKELDSAVDHDPKLSLIRQMLEFLTGKKMRVFDGQNFSANQSPASATDVAGQKPAAPPPAAGYGVEYDRHESYSETEQTRFSASGTVKTADGKAISFQIDLSMSRSYHEESDVSLRLGDAVRKTDPLILNFAGNAAELSDQRFSFDLNSDGKNEQINQLGQGSAYLVFDRNNDGKINNGHEMFGPSSGNGFAELSQLDDDKNGWIDENDKAFNQLQLWQKKADGSEQLQSLSAANVGAISLSQVATPFSIKNNANELLGEIRSSSVFLQEDGKAGTIQQIDLTV